jgi:hypothetical protein
MAGALGDSTRDLQSAFNEEYQSTNQIDESINTEEIVFETESNRTPINEEITFETESNRTNMTTTITVNGVNFTPTKGKGRVKQTLLHSKETRSKLNDEQKMKLLDNIQSKQQTLFHAITISVKDPAKMTNTYSLANLLTENKRNLAKYDLLDVYTIVFPKENCFIDGSNDLGLLEEEVTMEGTKQNKSRTLFEHYLHLTPEQVAASSRYYSIFMPEEQLYHQDLDWSLAYYEKNVESKLFSKVYGTMLQYESDEQGGPLFLKLLLDRVSTSGDSSLKVLIRSIKDYSVKKDCKGEDIDTVVGLFTAIIDNIHSLNNGELPTDTVYNLLNLFQTTSVDDFNHKFKLLQGQLNHSEINDEIDPNFRLRLRNDDGDSLKNNLLSAKYILNYAERAYRRLVRDGTWDEQLQKPPGASGFLGQATQPSHFQAPSGKPRSPPKSHPPNTCFNCEEPGCRVETCPQPRDTERIARNKAKHPTFIRLQESRHKWRPPESQEENRRVINGVPHLWNPTGGRNRKGRWYPEQSPTDGQSNEGETPSLAMTASDLTESTTHTSDYKTKAERKIHLHSLIQKAEEELADL